MKSKLRKVTRCFLATLCLSSMQILWAQSSNTGCGYSPLQKSTASLQPASFLTVLENNSARLRIVGFWKVKVVARNTPGIPDGTVLDEGYAVWHSDGTDIINSNRPPITGNTCLGVWKFTRRSTFKLNHYGLSWDPTGTFFIGPANLREEVVVSRDGNRYAGNFTVDQFDTNGNVLAHVVGEVTATRITAD